MRYKYCPSCGAPLVDVDIEGRPRQCCPDPQCGHVFWDNPVPAVGAIAEHQGKVILARNVAWPKVMFGLVTGFLEKDEHPAHGVVREVSEELGLTGEVRELVGLYPFKRMNQIVIVYHVVTEPGEVVLNEELAEYKALDPGEVRYWPSSTGWAVKDWLEARGHNPREADLPPQLRAYMTGE